MNLKGNNLIILAIGAIIIIVGILSLTIEVPNDLEEIELQNYGRSPEITGTQSWINSEPLQIHELEDKVVMIDFWTYSCINCIRTLPFLKAWHEKYADDGLVIIGVHTPEFEFEKDYNNVQDAVNDFEITYPVVQDNNFATWRAFDNNWWPRKFLIDTNGDIRYDHIGEGAYEETEKAIVQLLSEINDNTYTDFEVHESSLNYSNVGTPELYLGYHFARAPLGNIEGFQPDISVVYEETPIQYRNIIYLQGEWVNNADHVEAINNTVMSLVFQSKEANIVMGGEGTAQIYLNDVPIGINSGSDVFDNTVTIDDFRLYNLVNALDYGVYKLDIVADPGVKIYSFTFG